MNKQTLKRYINNYDSIDGIIESLLFLVDQLKIKNFESTAILLEQAATLLATTGSEGAKIINSSLTELIDNEICALKVQTLQYPLDKRVILQQLLKDEQRVAATKSIHAIQQLVKQDSILAQAAISIIYKVTTVMENLVNKSNLR